MRRWPLRRRRTAFRTDRSHEHRKYHQQQPQLRSNYRPSETRHSAAYRFTPNADWDYRRGLQPTSIAPASAADRGVMGVPCAAGSRCRRARVRPTWSRRRSRSTTGRRTSTPKASTWAPPFGARGGDQREVQRIVLRQQPQANRHRESVLPDLQSASTGTNRGPNALSWAPRARATMPTPSPRTPRSICRSGKAALSTRFSTTRCGRTIPS